MVKLGFSSNENERNDDSSEKHFSHIISHWADILRSGDESLTLISFLPSLE